MEETNRKQKNKKILKKQKNIKKKSPIYFTLQLPFFMAFPWILSRKRLRGLHVRTGSQDWRGGNSCSKSPEMAIIWGHRFQAIQVDFW